MPELETAVGVVISLLVRGEYATVEALTRGRRLSATEIEYAVRSYGQRLCQPPPGCWQRASVVPVVGVAPAVVMVDVPLWTDEEGESDLVLSLRLTEIATRAFATEVLDLHVP